MVKNYVKKWPTKYSKLDLMEAIRAVKEKNMKISIAANLPFMINVKLDRKNGAGTPTVLTPAGGKDIDVMLKILQEMDSVWPKNSQVYSHQLNAQPEGPNPFKMEFPGKIGGSCLWEKEISQRKPQRLLSHRASNATPAVFDKWFSKVNTLFHDIGFEDMDKNDLQHWIWNCDETGFCTSVIAKRILAKRVEKEAHETMGEVEENTLLF